jgi:hypothetical protein
MPLILSGSVDISGSMTATTIAVTATTTLTTTSHAKDESTKNHITQSHE